MSIESMVSENISLPKAHDEFVEPAHSASNTCSDRESAATGILLKGVSHENHKLLCVLGGYLSFTGRFPDSSSIRKPLEKAKEILRQLFKVDAQIGKIQSRMNGIEEEGQWLNCNARIEEITSYLRFLIADGIGFRLLLEKDIWPVIMAEGRFDSALLSLIAALRTIPHEEGIITIATNNIELPEVGKADRGLPRRYVSVLASYASTTPGRARSDRLAEGAGVADMLCARRIVKEMGGWSEIVNEPDNEEAIKLFIPAIPVSGKQ